MFKHLSHFGTKACILVSRKVLSSVCSQEVTVYLMLACVANRLPCRCLVRDPKRWKLLGVRLGLCGV